MTSLGEVAQFINGAAFKPEDWGDSGFPIIRIQNLTDASKPFNRTTRTVAEKLQVHPGDLLVSWSATLGVFTWNRPEIGLLNQHIFRVVPDESKVDKAYLRLALSGALSAMQKHLHGATMQHVNRGEFLGTPLYLPPLEEQRRIAAILDQAETLRTQRRTALALLDCLTQSLFLDMFGDPVANPKGWPVKPVSSLGKVVTGNTPSRDVPAYYGNSVEWIKSDNLNTPHYYVTNATEGLSEAGKAVGRLVPPNSILVTCIAGSPDCIGNAAMADREVAFNQQINAFIPVELDAHFAYAQIVVGKKLIQGASTNGMKGMVSKSRFEAIEFMVPPLPLQQTFATRIASIEALKATHRRALAALDALFASLQQRAFAGQL
ncbi:MAG: hypothetical protein ABS45_05635 [Comamonas sp. SCN 65-56]|uniref:restriction endonuclease subunit S n=1 Tax=Comamonas sp. SCN 65-56 TaxID=1660095 RepID=UPI00086834AC|nr:restriction endonuclease subunit S [Comamonas sp. SCN 65-56]ODS92678.1 MAG: hypothetical protein ABS45_05635 [Comamonas sp. SCN 65-56]